MVTKNFLNSIAMSLEAGGYSGGMPCRTVGGEYMYLTGGTMTPGSLPGPTLSPTDVGTSFGSGSTPPTEDDWQLENPITEGLEFSTTMTAGNDSPGYPYKQYNVTVTNTGDAPVTIREIGSKNNCSCSKYPGQFAQSYSVSCVCLMERTVLDTPITIAPGDAGIVTYKMRTIPRVYEEINGIQMAAFDCATDEQLAAILDAAIGGEINLQWDAGWRVGDKRLIHVDAWTGGNGVAHAAADMAIVISSFAEYNGCGNVLQFDFVDCFYDLQRMNSTNTTAGGYGATEMYTTTLPALVDALPSWLKSRLKTFSVLASKGGSEQAVIETVTGNKLALRASVEIFGADATYGQPGEGVQVEYYTSYLNTYAYIVGRKKSRGINAPSYNNTTWWTRSANTSGAFCNVTAIGQSSDSAASNAAGLSPFGCI